MRGESQKTAFRRTADVALRAFIRTARCLSLRASMAERRDPRRQRAVISIFKTTREFQWCGEMGVILRHAAPLTAPVPPASRGLRGRIASARCRRLPRRASGGRGPPRGGGAALDFREEGRACGAPAPRTGAVPAPPKRPGSGRRVYGRFFYSKSYRCAACSRTSDARRPGKRRGFAHVGRLDDALRPAPRRAKAVWDAGPESSCRNNDALRPDEGRSRPGQ